MSQKAFKKANKDFIKSKAATDRLLADRRALMEAYVKDLTPKESFDMRLDQLLLEYPHWDVEIDEENEEEGGRL